MLDKKVVFAELALVSMSKLMPDESRRESMKASIAFYLRRDAEVRSIECPAFDDLTLYLFPFNRYRVLFDVSTDVRVWSVTLLAAHRSM